MYYVWVLYTLLKVVSCYGVCSVHVSDGLPTQLSRALFGIGGGWMGSVSSIQFYFGFLDILTLQSP